MQARVKWVEDSCFMGESGSGHTVIMDVAPEFGGRDLGIRPMEMVLIGLGGCTEIDILSILRKQRQDVTDCIVEVSAERAESIPKVFTKIHLHFIIKGRNLKPSFVEQAINLSADKYCSVSKMLEKTATMTHDYELVELESN